MRGNQKLYFLSGIFCSFTAQVKCGFSARLASQNHILLGSYRAIIRGLTCLIKIYVKTLRVSVLSVSENNNNGGEATYSTNRNDGMLYKLQNSR